MPPIVREMKLSNIAFARRLRAMLRAAGIFAFTPLMSLFHCTPHQVHCPMRVMEGAQRVDAPPLLHDDVEPLRRRRRWPRQAHGSLHHTSQRADSGSR